MHTDMDTDSGQRGSVTVWLLVVPVLIMVLGGLSVDLWAALSAQNRIAAIADEAAAAGATAVSPGVSRSNDQALLLDPAEAERRALQAVDTHPGADQVTGRSVVARTDLVAVTVEGNSEFLFLRLLGATSIPVRVTGAASSNPSG